MAQDVRALARRLLRDTAAVRTGVEYGGATSWNAHAAGQGPGTQSPPREKHAGMTAKRILHGA